MSKLNDVKRTPQMIAADIYSIKGQTGQVILHSSAEIRRRLVHSGASNTP
jgi:Protein of unknown function (DUF3102)